MSYAVMPHDDRTLWNLALSLHTAGRLDEARQTYEQLIHQTGDSQGAPGALVNIGVTFEQQGRYGDAAGCYVRATLHPATGAFAGLRLGDVLTRYGDGSAAEWCLARVPDASRHSALRD